MQHSIAQPIISNDSDPDDWLQPEDSPVLARITRRPRLQAVVDTEARCTTADQGLFFRTDHELLTAWQARQPEAVRVCRACPARTACLELALRDGEGMNTLRGDDMIRAGHTAQELNQLGTTQARSLQEAVARDAEDHYLRRRQRNLTIRLRQALIAAPTSRAADPAETRYLITELRAIRTLRHEGTAVTAA
ncbi:WhiB family transcriptional regulator [Streptomyces amakusaensis]|uniref:WhiB family transcriptional regulator n=1 Tax=Streptomyces amakusaensis TaxID=67271 RepID=A0ABW0AS49_9ACTN